MYDFNFVSNTLDNVDRQDVLLIVSMIYSYPLLYSTASTLLVIPMMYDGSASMEEGE